MNTLTALAEGLEFDPQPNLLFNISVKYISLAGLAANVVSRHLPQRPEDSEGEEEDGGDDEDEEEGEEQENDDDDDMEDKENEETKEDKEENKHEDQGHPSSSAYNCVPPHLRNFVSIH